MRGDPRRRDLAAYPWTTEIQTRFADLDFNVHVNNVAVAQLCEESRVRFNTHLADTRSIGRPRYLIARIEIDYLGEIGYPAPVVAAAAALSVGRTSWRIGLGLFQRGVCCALCDAVMVHRGADGGPAPIPDALRSVLGESGLHA